MQTWAKRGVQAALVTGGVLAAGSGVTSADTCSDRPASPLGGPALTPSGARDGSPGTSGRCFSGELFPEELAGSAPPQADAGRALGRSVTIVGTLDPVRDVLPAVEDALTHELPRVTDQHWFRQPRSAEPAHSLELAGWVADTSRPGDETTGRHGGVRIGTPAEGFHRSLSWTGPIGSVVGGAGAAGEGNGAAGAGDGFRGADRSAAGAELVIPADDPAVLEGFDQAGGIVQLWEEALGRAQAAAGARSGLLAPTTDLTEVRVNGLTPEIHDIPHELLGPALLQGRPAERAAQSESVPLQVPGEYQEQVNEVPDLADAGLLALVRDADAAAREGGGNRGAEVLLPVPGEPNVLGTERTSAPSADRTAAAVPGPRVPVTGARELHETQVLPRIPAFSRTPELTAVTVTIVDELFAAMPERDRVTEIPLRHVRVPRSASTGGVSLPILDGGVAAAERNPAVTPALTELDTARLLPVAGRRY